MKSGTWFSLSFPSLVVALSLGLAVSACSSDKDGSDPDGSGGGGSDPMDTADLTDTGDGGEEDSSIGDPIGDPVPIDHETALQTVVDNLTRHIDGLESSLTFLEASGRMCC